VRQTTLSDARWWLSHDTDKQPHEIIEGIVRTLRNKQQYRREQARINAEYYGVDLQSFGLSSSSFPNHDILSLNAAENTIDTVVSKTAKSRVIPMAVTRKATWEQRERAKKFNQFIEGLFDSAGVYDVDPKLVTDTLIFGTGVAKIFVEDGKVQYDRVFCWELMVDDSEARYGKPRSLYQRHYIDRLVLKEMYSDDKEACRAIDNVVYSGDGDEMIASDTTSDMVVVIEAWHLPSGCKAKDGRYCRIIAGHTLDDEPYDSNQFPFVLMYEKPPVAGIWGRALMTRILPAQKEFDRLNIKIQDAHAVMGVPRLLVQRGSNVVRAHLDDQMASIVEYDGPNPPQEWNAQPISADTYSYRNQLAEDMLRYSPTNEMSAQGQVPAGLSQASGKALQVFNDSESERMAVFWKERERFYVEVAKLMLAAAREIANDDPDYVVRAKSKKSLELIRFGDIDIADDEYVLDIWPTNLLEKTPGARYAQLSEMRNRGDITPAQFRQLSEMPDLESENDLDTAPEQIVDMVIGLILTDGKSVTVEPFDNHALIIERGSKAYAMARKYDVDEDKKELLRRYIEDAQAYIDTAATAGLPPPDMLPTVGPADDPTLVPGGMPPPDMMSAPPDMGGDMGGDMGEMLV